MIWWTNKISMSFKVILLKSCISEKKVAWKPSFHTWKYLNLKNILLMYSDCKGGLKVILLVLPHSKPFLTLLCPAVFTGRLIPAGLFTWVPLFCSFLLMSGISGTVRGPQGRRETQVLVFLLPSCVWLYFLVITEYL